MDGAAAFMLYFSHNCANDKIPRRNNMLYDKDIREPLFDYLEERFGKSRIFEEVPMSRARADVMMVLPDELVGIEIKSSVDTYERLKGQVRNYNKFCDRCYAAVGLRHAKHISEHIPDFWGILCIYEDNRRIIIEELREALSNPKLNPDFQLSLLWKNELSNILAQNGLPKYRQQSKAFVRKKLIEKVPAPLLKKQMCEELFERDYTVWEN